MKRNIFITRAIILLLGFLFSSHVHSQKSEIPSKRPDIQTMEKRLFELVNKEREKRKIRLLRHSQDLRSLARKHSQDMAKHEDLSHLSSSGESYQNRLVKAGFFFSQAGENVAYSETFLDDIIHESLMKSPDHRENILTVDFDQIGIGVVYKEDKGYYITQDFSHSIELMTNKESRQEIQERINEIRKKIFLPPIRFTSGINELADTFSKRKAEGKSRLQIPKALGETHAFFITAPLIDMVIQKLKEIKNASYEEGAVGVWFDRNKDYPGGAYFITLFLFPENKYKYANKNAAQDVVLKELNRIRLDKGLGRFKLDKELSSEAEKISRLSMAQKGEKFVLPLQFAGYWVLSYVTEDLTLLPSVLHISIERLMTNRIGIGLVFEKTTEFPRGTFYVAILYSLNYS